MELRSFNKSGLRAFQEQFILVSEHTLSSLQQSILVDEELSTAYGSGIMIEHQSFATRWALGMYLAEVLDGLPEDEIAMDTGLWNWITAFYFDQLFPGPRGGSSMERYILDLNNSQTWYRHLVRTPWSLVRSHGDCARVVLTSRVNELSDELEQLVSRQDFLAGTSILEAASRLYLRHDEEVSFLARKARDKKGTPGSLRRFVRIVQQLWCTWDLIGMPADELLGLLPEEFQPWLDAAQDE